MVVKNKKPKISLQSIILICISINIIHCVLNMSLLIYGSDSRLLNIFSLLRSVSRYVIVMLTIIQMVSKKIRFEKWRIYLLICLVFFSMLVYLTKQSFLFFDIFFIAIVWGNTIEYKRIIDVFFWTIFGTTIFIILLYSLKMLPVLHFTRGRNVERLTFGFSHPNTTGQIFLVLCCLYYLKRDDLFDVKDMIILAMAGYFIYYFPNSVTSALMIFALDTIQIVKTLYEKISHKQFLSGKVTRYSVVFLPIIITCSVLYISLNLVGENIISNISSTLFSRFKWAYIGIKRYGITMFGTEINFYGTADILLNPNSSKGYFVIDCFYIYFLVVWGVVYSVYYLYMIFISIRISANKKMSELIIIFLILLIYSISETLFTYYISFFVFLCAFSNIDSRINMSRLERPLRNLDKSQPAC